MKTIYSVRLTDGNRISFRRTPDGKDLCIELLDAQDWVISESVIIAGPQVKDIAKKLMEISFVEPELIEELPYVITPEDLAKYDYIIYKSDDDYRLIQDGSPTYAVFLQPDEAVAALKKIDNVLCIAHTAATWFYVKESRLNNVEKV